MVGCVIAKADGEVIAEGFHRTCGGPHAEVEALRAAGTRARGATALVTLEPCAHQGRTGPCADALIAAGIARVLYAVADPNPLAGGGAARLAARGVQTERFAHPGAEELARPFIKRVTTGLPWVSAKWAQSIDGAVALANAQSKWLSGARSRGMVHRERGRVDAILTGIGTVLEDDPMLTPRGVRVLRAPRRIIFDPEARTPLEARVCSRSSADSVAETIVLVSAERDGAAQRRLERLRAHGVEAIDLGPNETLRPALVELGARGVATVLVEAGGGLIGRLLQERLLDEAWVFVAPLLIGDDLALRCARGVDWNAATRSSDGPTSSGTELSAIPRARLLGVRRRGDDTLLHFRY